MRGCDANIFDRKKVAYGMETLWVQMFTFSCYINNLCQFVSNVDLV